MVCPRCIMAVENTLKEQGLKAREIVLGKILFENEVSEDQLAQLEQKLNVLGFERVKTREMKLVEDIKTHLIGLINQGAPLEGINLSNFIQENVGEEYTKLSALFSSLQGLTIERYFINLKIEKVKEWLSYGDYNISETAWKLGYSSIQHLSSQFKKTTGMTPSQYKKLSEKPRQGLDKI